MPVRVIFIETAGSDAPTLAGRLVYPFADLFIAVARPPAPLPAGCPAEGLLL
ncbi:MAG: hypothetical protein R3D25_07445 [Geminicoccaceae bacterium]